MGGRLLRCTLPPLESERSARSHWVSGRATTPSLFADHRSPRESRRPCPALGQYEARDGVRGRGRRQPARRCSLSPSKAGSSGSDCNAAGGASEQPRFPDYPVRGMSSFGLEGVPPPNTYEEDIPGSPGVLSSFAAIPSAAAPDGPLSPPPTRGIAYRRDLRLARLGVEGDLLGDRARDVAPLVERSRSEVSQRARGPLIRSATRPSAEVTVSWVAFRASSATWWRLPRGSGDRAGRPSGKNVGARRL